MEKAKRKQKPLSRTAFLNRWIGWQCLAIAFCIGCLQLLALIYPPASDGQVIRTWVFVYFVVLPVTVVFLLTMGQYLAIRRTLMRPPPSWIFPHLSALVLTVLYFFAFEPIANFVWQFYQIPNNVYLAYVWTPPIGLAIAAQIVSIQALTERFSLWLLAYTIINISGYLLTVLAIRVIEQPVLYLMGMVVFIGIQGFIMWSLLQLSMTERQVS